MAARNSLLRQYERYPPVDLSRYRKLVVAGRHVGWVSGSTAKLARTARHIFAVDDHVVRMQDELDSAKSRTQALAELLDRWREKGLVPGWRDELYPVNRTFGEPPLLLIERAAAPLFGILCYAVNVNGLTDRDGISSVWIARRSSNKSVDPGMLDVVVGGGQPHHLSLVDNILKECREEAGIPAALAMKARPCSLITLMVEAKEGLHLGMQFNFDLELASDFQPDNKDGEVAEFLCWPIDRLMQSLGEDDDFMFDVALAKIDLLVRKGAIGPDHADYLPLVAGLRRSIPFEAT